MPTTTRMALDPVFSLEFFVISYWIKEYGMSHYSKTGRRGARVRTSWDDVADWYDGWNGKHGSAHHRKFAIPAVLHLLKPQPGEHILDIGAGQGVLAPFIAGAGATYTGVDASPKLLSRARKYHGHLGRFLCGDARNLSEVSELRPAGFDAVVFLLSIQDMDPLDPVFRSTDWALKPGGRVALLMTHPCFRPPRQSGWGWDRHRKLHYRRVDRYLTPFVLPNKIKTHPAQKKTLSFHRPLETYINGLARCGPVCRPHRRGACGRQRVQPFGCEAGGAIEPGYSVVFGPPRPEGE